MLDELIEGHRLILAEAGLVERLRRATRGPRLDRVLIHAPLIYDETGRESLGAIYREYLDIADRAGLPLLLGTPTWRTNLERIEATRCERDINEDAVRFLDEVRAARRRGAPPAPIGGIVGCRGDAYRPAEGLPADEAEAFHAWQVERLALAGADYLLGVTLPALPEATGIALAMAATEIPYLISFVIGRNGRMLDGTRLPDAMASIDDACSPAPTAYMVNCAYPSFLEAAYARGGDLSRLVGIQANASSRDHDDLDGASELQGDDLDDWLDRMVALHRERGLQVLGGCCGTDGRHLTGLMRRLR